jgi:hypothetical protein
VLADDDPDGGNLPRSRWARPRMPDLRTASGWAGQQQVQQQ